MIFRRKSDTETTGVVAQSGPTPSPESLADRVNDAELDRPDPDRLRAEADAALDHALREEPVEETVEDYDDDGSEHPVTLPAGLSGNQPPTEPPNDEAAGADDEPAEGEEYVLYSDVQPHLEELARLQIDRQRFIELCLYARDRVSSQAAADRIDAGLRELEIEPLRPDGERFDPALHEAGGTLATDDPALHGLIAETETPGYSDRGHVVRPPIVTVYRAESA